MGGFLELFDVKKPILAMLHLKGDGHEEKMEIARRELDIYYSNHIDAVIVEDYYGDKHDVEAVLEYMQRTMPDKIYGVNVLNNFHRSYELASLYGAKFVQIDSIAGHLPEKLDAPYENMVRGYRALGDVMVLGGVRFKYQPVLSGRTLAQDLALGKQRCDAIVVTGEGTGLDTDDAKIAEFRKELGEFPLIVGAGVTPETLKAKLSLCDAAIVGSCFKDTRKDTGDVCAEHVRAFMNKVMELR